MKKFYFTFILLMICCSIKAQYSCYEPDVVIQRSIDHCARALPENWSDSNLFARNFIPNDSTTLITIPVNVNVWREDDGTGNWWLDTPDRRDSLQQAYNWLNYIYSHNEPYTLNIPNSQFIEDTKVRFVIDTVFYYNNSRMAHKAHPDSFTVYLLANYPERLNTFNYHLSLDTVLPYSGRSSGYDVEYPAIVSIRQLINRPRELYAFAMHMAHEFGHNFGLRHTYDNSEELIIAHPDFLWDVFGTETQPWCTAPPTEVCHHDGGWSCNPLDTTNTCTK